MTCEEKYCNADSDYRDTFDLTENGDTITIYVDKMSKHHHVMKFLFEDKVMIMGMKDGILQLWRESND